MIWFALGIFLAFNIIDLKAIYNKITMAVFFAAAIALSIYYYRELNGDLIIQTIIGVPFVVAILVLSQNFSAVTMCRGVCVAGSVRTR